MRSLEQRLGVALFRRLPRGLKITAEGEALLPVVSDAFDRLATTLDRVEAGQVRELLVVGAVGTFAVGWLLPRLAAFRRAHPFVELRLSTNNNRVDLAAEGLDFSIRFGNGAWHGLDATELFDAPLTPLCTPELAATLQTPRDLAGLTPAQLPHGRVEHLVRRGRRGSALEHRERHRLRLVARNDGGGPAGDGGGACPGAHVLPSTAPGADPAAIRCLDFARRYWLTRLKSRKPTAAMWAFADWITAQEPDLPKDEKVGAPQAKRVC